jgi:hypothetical protein
MQTTGSCAASGTINCCPPVSRVWSDENLTSAATVGDLNGSDVRVHSGKGPDHPELVSRLNDQDLARQAALGDRFAFAEIFDRHAAAMFR